MIARDEYLKLIEEIRNIEKHALDGYITKKLQPLAAENDFFVETLYKDIFYILDGVDKEGEGDLIIEDNDLAFEDGDLKVTGYQTTLHHIQIWLHIEISQKYLERDFETIKTLKDIEQFKFLDGLRNFEANTLLKDTYTVEYRRKLDAIRRSLKKERLENFDQPKPLQKLLIKLFDFDYWDFKLTIPNVGTVNLMNVVHNLRSKNRTERLKNLYSRENDYSELMKD